LVAGINQTRLLSETVSVSLPVSTKTSDANIFVATASASTSPPPKVVNGQWSTTARFAYGTTPDHFKSLKHCTGTGTGTGTDTDGSSGSFKGGLKTVNAGTVRLSVAPITATSNSNAIITRQPTVSILPVTKPVKILPGIASNGMSVDPL
jgi:hypothetical protein